MKNLKAFLSANSSILSKLAVTQLGMTFFGLLVTMAAAGRWQATGNPFLLALASCFSILFYLFLQYTHMKEYAMRDEIRIDAGRMKRKPLTGLYVSLIANSLNLLLALVTCIAKLFISNIGFFADYAEGVNYTPEIAVNIASVSQLIAQWAQAMYLGLLDLIAPGNPLLLFVIVLPSLLVCYATYAVITSGKADHLLRAKPDKKGGKR